MASEQNKEYFNNEAAAYDAKHAKTLDRIVEEIRARLDFIGVEWVDEDADSGSVRLLDYACGTGVVSRALAPYTTQCVGIDLSENMVAQYNARAENQGLARDEMYAYQGNLLDPNDPDPREFSGFDFHHFDIAVVGLGFHHFDDPALAAQRLVERLRPGGVLLILDFLPHGKVADDGHAASHTITHHGFSEEQVKKIFQDAGAGKDFALETIGIAFNKATENRPEEVRRQVFLARGTKE
ncbi:S-adenosyl-L-methionine-dependent methyltransferase [Neurospora crassa]|uniref:S-adenosyl-L-methionine-dependent methyltransferase n=1 Tax=Neurospora crassa (strain ATCC 24698 / 74-OR23-1A / CBS 708.71 / DSM 1257 / FGSC 987) TaxID=367110 RepID=Q7SH84_NEUCR|nr:hypothetical protein NCU01922 [Neurospora crassa OR74A]EAA36317.3 hypothetical protein NCU01922 [Neurospora crassa OR74A]KAK3500992.1 S-adenosyl-L-methionine-dependent methyltransferase [Neurospora crassa]KHE83012.1 S-adenosyl-L-methionine-dependent methyltransferase [Neurospora crassa]|eukprot:XP_965553.3 hypothetical protein NCU01922 [Neurospora crassa OR74A]